MDLNGRTVGGAGAGARGRCRGARTGAGRPWRGSREVLNGILWILRTGAQWADVAGGVPAVPDLPPALPALGPRRHAGAGAGGAGPRPQGARQARPLRVLHRRHVHRGEKRGGCVGPTKRGKGTKLMAVADRFGLPLAACAASASPHESTLVAATLDSRFVADLPERLIGDRAYDADPLDDGLGRAGHRDDRAASPRPDASQDAGWPPAAPLPAPVEGRAALRLAGQLPPPGRPLRAACAQLPRLRPPRLHPHPAPPGSVTFLHAPSCTCSASL